MEINQELIRNMAKDQKIIEPGKLFIKETLKYKLIGGEPLVWPDFEKSVSAIDPSCFHISITTNGWMLAQERAKHLAELGIDKVGISDEYFKGKRPVLKKFSYISAPGGYFIEDK